MSSSDFLSTASCSNLEKRAALLRIVRRFFDELGFFEVQTPVLSQDIVVDRHLDPLTVHVSHASTRHENDLWYLQTSPEQNMKRLLASGMKAIYQIGPVFREGEQGRLHNPEFTMVEWYRVGDDYEQGMELLCRLVERCIHAPLAARRSYQEAFSMVTGLDPIECPLGDLAAYAIQHQFVEGSDWSDDRDDWCDLIFSMAIQPRLGLSEPVVLTHFPASQAALAKTCSQDSRLAERFEYFYHGIELANGYHELLDPNILRDRNREANAFRRHASKKTLPEKSRLLDAMEYGMPACTGCALGFDRLVMLALQVKTIDEVICFPWDRA